MNRRTVLQGLASAALAVVIACNGGGGGDTEEVVEEVPVSEVVEGIPASYSPPTFNFTISGECQAVTEITGLDLMRGQMVTYCNKWGEMATLSFSVAGFLPDGATSVTLFPGDCISYEVPIDLEVGPNVVWSLNCQDFSGPMGGGPVKVQDQPPGGTDP
jgi:hypothetical protein